MTSNNDEYEINSDNKALVDTAWMQDASCVFFPEINFYSSSYDEIKIAKNVCETCPVKKECLQMALDTNQRYGVWGGSHAQELRQVQSIDHDGMLLVHQKPIQCLYCHTKKFLEVTERRRTKTKITCTNCQLSWYTRRIIGRRLPIVW